MEKSRPKDGAWRPSICRLRRLAVLAAVAAVRSVASLSSSPKSPPSLPDRQQPQRRQEDPSEVRRQQSRHVGNNPLLSLNLNLDALAKAQAADRAQELYQRIAALHREGYYAVSPDVVSFNSVLKAWQLDPSKALEFWEREVDHLSEPNKPNIRSFNTFLLALANAGLYKPAEELLEQMQSPDSAVVPDRISYNTVLLAYALSPEPSAAPRADALLRKMLLVSENDPCSGDTAMARPDAVSFNTVISAWAAHPIPFTAAQKSEEWLEYLKTNNCNGVLPDVYTYTTVLQAWTRYAAATQRQQKVAISVRQSDKTNAHATAAALVASQRANELLEDDPTVRPDTIAFSALMDGYAKRAAEAPQSALAAVSELLQQMKELSVTWPDTGPNHRTYTSVLNAVAQSRIIRAGELAQDYLQDMRESGLAPSVIHYNAALNAWAKCPRPDKATHAWRMWQEMQQVGVAPDVITYNTFLAATANIYFGSSSSLDPHHQYEKKKAVLDMGLAVFKALHDDPDCEPTTLSYHYWFKTVRKLMPASTARQKVVKHAFTLCCQQGCLNDMVLQYMLQRIVTTREEIQALVSGLAAADGALLLSDDDSYKISVADLPPAWSRRALGVRSNNHNSRQPS
jgi:hypothetical protein